MVKRLEGQVAATPTPIGLLPKDINTEGLSVNGDAFASLMTVAPAEQARELDDAEVFLSSSGAALPAAITSALEETAGVCSRD